MGSMGGGGWYGVGGLMALVWLGGAAFVLALVWLLTRNRNRS